MTNDSWKLDGVTDHLEIDTSPDEKQIPLPHELPILPLRGLVVFPLTAVPLTIGQPRSIRMVEDASLQDRLIGLVLSKNAEIETPLPADLHSVGTLALIHRKFSAPDGTIRLLVQGISRFKIIETVSTDPYIRAIVEPFQETREDGLEVSALLRNVKDQFTHISEMIPSFPEELVNNISIIEDPLRVVYTIANFQRMEVDEAQHILEIESLQEKLHHLVSILVRESEILELGQKIQNEARSKIEKYQREYYLREQIRAIQKELGEEDDVTSDVEDFRKKIEGINLPSEAKTQAQRELDRLSRLPSSSPEYGVIRTYLDWVVSLPWSKVTPDNLDITHARNILDEDHFGLKEVKERILEFLAVRLLRQQRGEELEKIPTSDSIRRERQGVILCFVGPPGVGKTSLGQSIARAMGRNFIHTALGGIRDEAEIRGHRRTYIGAMPGRIIQAMRRVNSKNPVFMLDEIDKLTYDFHGDPASALLEVLDPEQNTEFWDNYLEVPFDLSQVMFITTANVMDTIPVPLQDRMEIIRIPGYTEREKVEIAQHYLIPRQVRETGLFPQEVKFSQDAIQTVIRKYTRESGVRNLDRNLGGVCRKLAIRVAQNQNFPENITPEIVRETLGRPKFFGMEEIASRITLPGIATGLAVTSAGGDILFIEATQMPGSKGFTVTGSVGNVMQESARAAFSYVRSRMEKFAITPEQIDKIDIHLHIPAGSQPKDGPSAGITIITALVSLLTGRMVRPEVGMTGEITLRGQVLPVGGIKEKVLAAHRFGLKEVILPRLNEPDLEELPEEVISTIKFTFADTVDSVLDHVLEKPKRKRNYSQKATNIAKQRSSKESPDEQSSTGG
ncbi:MAG TPA: endopeptidase La [Anaerolineaceae bacterium]